MADWNCWDYWDYWDYWGYWLIWIVLGLFVFTEGTILEGYHEIFWYHWMIVIDTLCKSYILNLPIIYNCILLPIHIFHLSPRWNRKLRIPNILLTVFLRFLWFQWGYLFLSIPPSFGSSITTVYLDIRWFYCRFKFTWRNYTWFTCILAIIGRFGFLNIAIVGFICILWRLLLQNISNFGQSWFTIYYLVVISISNLILIVTVYIVLYC